MLTQEFKQASSDAGVFVYRHKDGKIVIALVYVDDGIFLGHDPKLIDRKKHACLEHWECHNTGDIKEFLGMQINKTAHRIEVNQINYLKQILQQFDMTNVKVTKTPLPSGYIPQPNTAAVNPKQQQHFQQVIRSLLYLMLRTQPDISSAVIKMSQFMANPSQEHLDKAMHIFQYLASTQNYQLVYKGGQTAKSLMGFMDSNWAADLATC